MQNIKSKTLLDNIITLIIVLCIIIGTYPQIRLLRLYQTECLPTREICGPSKLVEALYTTNPLQLKWLRSPVEILGIHVSYDEKGNNQVNFNFNYKNCKPIWICGGHVILHYLGEYL